MLWDTERQKQLKRKLDSHPQKKELAKVKMEGSWGESEHDSFKGEEEEQWNNGNFHNGT